MLRNKEFLKDIEIENLKQLLAQKENEIAEKDEVIAEKDELIAQLKTTRPEGIKLSAATVKKPYKKEGDR
jgi:hypothetical protein